MIKYNIGFVVLIRVKNEGLTIKSGLVEHRLSVWSETEQNNIKYLYWTCWMYSLGWNNYSTFDKKHFSLNKDFQQIIYFQPVEAPPMQWGREVILPNHYGPKWLTIWSLNGWPFGLQMVDHLGPNWLNKFTMIVYPL